MPVPELPGQPEAITIGQADIHGHHVGPDRSEHPWRVRGRPAFGDDLNVGMLRDKFAQAVASKGMTIDDGKTDRH